MPDNLKQKTIKGASWSIVEQVLTRGVNLVISVVLARLLSPSDYGLVGMMGIFIALSQLFIDGGLTGALIRTKDASEKDFSTVYIINLVMSVVFYAILFFCAPLVADFYGQPLLRPLMRVFALIIVLGSISSVHGTRLTMRLDFRTKTRISILSAIISGVIGLICAYRGMGVWALVVQSLSSSLVLMVLTMVLVRWMPRLAFSVASFKRLFSYSSKMLVASVISVIYENSYALVIGKRFSSADLGQYSQAGKFPQVTNSVIVGALNRVAFPVLSQVQDDDERLLRAYEKYIQLTCFIIFPLLLWMCGAARPLVSYLLTDKWLPCVPLMQMICIGKLTEGITRINLNLLYVKGRSDLVLRLEVIKKVIAFSILFATMFFDITVMCLGQVAYAFIAMYLNTYYTKKILGYGIWSQIKVIYPYFLISLAVLTEALLAAVLIPNRLVALAVSLLLGGLSYFLLSRWSGVYAYQEALSVAKAAWRKLPWTR